MPVADSLALASEWKEQSKTSSQEPTTVMGSAATTQRTWFELCEKLLITNSIRTQVPFPSLFQKGICRNFLVLVFQSGIGVPRPAPLLVE